MNSDFHGYREENYSGLYKYTDNVNQCFGSLFLMNIDFTFYNKMCNPYFEVMKSCVLNISKRFTIFDSILILFVCSF